MSKNPNRTSEKMNDNERPELSIRSLLRCFHYVRPYLPLAISATILCCICVWAEMALIRCAGELIDRPDIMTASIWVLVSPFLFYGVLNRITGGTQWMLAVYTANKAILHLRWDFFAKLQTLSKSFYDRHKAGWLVSRNSSDLAKIGDFLTYPIMMCAILITTLFFAIIQISKIAPIMLLPAFITAPGFICITIYYRNRMRKAQRKASEQNSRIVANIAETVRGIRVIQAFSREEKNFKSFEALNLENRDLNISLAKLNGLFMPSLDFIGMLNMTLVIAFSFWLIKNNYTTISGTPITSGDIAQYVLYMNAILHPLRMVTDLYGLTIASSAAAERIFEIMDMQPEIYDKDNAKDLFVDGSITLENLSFRYSSDTPLIIENANLEIPAGQTLAIVGETGVGKTTLASLIARFYDPNSGRILIDGIDIKDVKSESLHQQMGFVPQQGYLFSGTVMENLKFAAPNIDDEAVIEICKSLGAHNSITSLPQSYYTEVIEGGDGLSLGQRQIIAIARAIIGNPKIIIMDEPTSSLDVYHERIIQNALNIICKNRTTIVIAHRLSTVENADKIILLENAKITESGTHQELLAINGSYAKMYKRGYEGILDSIEVKRSKKDTGSDIL